METSALLKRNKIKENALTRKKMKKKKIQCVLTLKTITSARKGKNVSNSSLINAMPARLKGLSGILILVVMKIERKTNKCFQ